MKRKRTGRAPNGLFSVDFPKGAGTIGCGIEQTGSAKAAAVPVNDSAKSVGCTPAPAVAVRDRTHRREPRGALGWIYQLGNEAIKHQANSCLRGHKHVSVIVFRLDEPVDGKARGDM